MVERKRDTPRGLLYRAEGKRNFHLERYAPSPLLAPFVEHYWHVRWDLRGLEPYVSQNLPYPSMNLVLEMQDGDDHLRVYGVATGRFERRLVGMGQVIGVKFRPGAFHAFVGGPIARFTDRVVLAHELFAEEATLLHEALLQQTAEKSAEKSMEDSIGDNIEASMDCLETFLQGQNPQPDVQIELVNRVADTIRDEIAVTKVDHVAERFDISKRTLQRLFHQYVGVGPKWVIQRYRLHEALEEVDRNQCADWATLAQRLGYFDQAHFINDFKSMVGVSPEEYARQYETPLSTLS